MIMKPRFLAFDGTVRRFVLHGRLIRVSLARDGWWITDLNGFEHHLPFSVQRIVAPDGLVAWRLTAWRLNIEMGKMQNARPHAEERSDDSVQADVGETND